MHACEHCWPFQPNPMPKTEMTTPPVAGPFQPQLAVLPRYCPPRGFWSRLYTAAWNDVMQVFPTSQQTSFGSLWSGVASGVQTEHDLNLFFSIAGRVCEWVSNTWKT